MFYEIPVHFDMFVGTWMGEGVLDGVEFQIHADSSWNVIGAAKPGHHIVGDKEVKSRTTWEADGGLCMYAGRLNKFFPATPLYCGYYHMGQLWFMDATGAEYVINRQS